MYYQEKGNRHWFPFFLLSMFVHIFPAFKTFSQIGFSDIYSQ